MSAENSGEKSSEEEDLALKMLTARRMLELKKRASNAARQSEEKAAPKPPSDREVLLKALRERGDEVLASAEAGYPREMAILVPRLADLIRSGKVTTISGGDLLQFLRSLGMRVSVRTSISVTEHGKTVSLADKLKQQND